MTDLFLAFIPRKITALVCTMLLTACGAPSSGGPAALQSADEAGKTLDLKYAILRNRGEGRCALPDGRTTDESPCYEAYIELKTSRDIALGGLKIFFSQTDPVGLVASGDAAIRHINGDLHELSFTEPDLVMRAEESFRIDFTVKGLNLTEAKMMPNYYVVDRTGAAAIIDSTRETPRPYTARNRLPHVTLHSDENLRRAARDKTPLATAKGVFHRHAGVKFMPAAVDTGVIPRPASLRKLSESGRLDLADGFSLMLAGVSRGDIETAVNRLTFLGLNENEDGVPVRIAVDNSRSIKAEGYRLNIASTGVDILARDQAGAYYALQSLAALISLGETALPLVEIDDAPRFGFRGMHLDVARNFHGKETVIRLMDQMAAYKLNKLHLHLADDEGWRLEIRGLPELTEIGARRCHDLSEDRCLLPQLGSGPFPDTSGSGYFTQDDYREILQAARARHIEIIPSLDMPGHSRAAVKAMEARYRRLTQAGRVKDAEEFLLSDPGDKTEYLSIQYYKDNTINVCRESAYHFIGYVLDDLIRLHEEAGAPLKRYHIGADETAGAWKDSPICADFLYNNDAGVESADQLGAYFIERVANMVSKRGLIPAAWSDGLSHVDPARMPATVQSNAWGVLAWGGAQTAHQHANNGWQVVVSLPDALYFDFPYEAHWEEGGYYWAARRVDTRKVFSTMPQNLPAHALYWRDRDEQPIMIDDRTAPLKPDASFIGMQGHLWTETVRDRDTLEYQVFPRLLALAERAWSKADWEIPYDAGGAVYNGENDTLDEARRIALQQDWNRFASIVAAKEFPKLEAADVSFRLPTAGAKIRAGDLTFNTAFPALSVEATTGDNWREASSFKSHVQPLQLRTRLDERSGRPIRFEPESE